LRIFFFYDAGPVDETLLTSQTHAVWVLVDCVFRLVGLVLEWHFEKDDASAWRAEFCATSSPAVVVDHFHLSRAK
jgi:hypothetical protein